MTMLLSLSVRLLQDVRHCARRIEAWADRCADDRPVDCDMVTLDRDHRLRELNCMVDNFGKAVSALHTASLQAQLAIVTARLNEKEA